MPVEEAIERIAQRVTQHLQAVSTQEPPKSKPEAEEPISIDEACALLKISRVTLNNWRHQGLVTVHGMGRRKYLYKSELMESLKQPKRHGGRGNRGLSRYNAESGRAA
nr:helix-turn-helix domain-containing protein [Pontibacter harenae]